MRHRAQDTDEHRGQGDEHQQRIQAAVGEHGGAHADDGVDTNLGQQAREHGGDQRWGSGVGVGKPGIQRENRGFNTEGDQQHAENRGLRATRNIFHALANLGQIHRADGRVGYGNAEQEHHGAGHRDHHITHTGANARGGSTQRHQDIRGHQEDFEADVQVEQVTCQE